MKSTFRLIGTLTAVQPLATASKDLIVREGGKGKPTPIPSMVIAGGKHLLFPATGIRGKLRRAADDLIRRKIAELTGNDKPFSLDDLYVSRIGGNKGSTADDRASVTLEATIRAQNPHLSLFGAGAAGALGFVAGRLSVGNAITQLPCEPVTFSGARTDELYRNKELVNFLSEDDVASLVERAEGGSERSKLLAQIKAHEKELRKCKDEDRRTELTGLIAELKAQMDKVIKDTGTSEVSIGMPLAGWLAIPQGQVLDHGMAIYRATDIELGLLLCALEEMAAEPILGAHRACGCGMISGHWEVEQVAVGGKKTLLGTVAMQPFGGLELQGEGLLAAKQAFLDWFATGEGVFTAPPSATKKKKADQGEADDAGDTDVKAGKKAKKSKTLEAVEG